MTDGFFIFRRAHLRCLNINSLNSKVTLLENAKLNLQQTQTNLTSIQEGQKDTKVDSQKYSVSAARARLLLSENEYERGFLRAPFPGKVADMNISVGELVSVGKSSVSIISDSNFQIESKISEIDIAKILQNSQAEVSFDAYENLKFQAIVSNISSGGVITDGVPTYKTIFTILDKDERIRSGMTANILVQAKQSENALSVPAKFVLSKDGKKYVLVKNSVSNNNEERIVTLGVRDAAGKVEIVSGLSEGEEVIYKK
jgi:HlyD family secretion protein